ncbi:HNH endonuclease [Mesorhizobium sp.]|uniref:HNH endonuclease n=1 Tax=Mesorhizobium sp. TaxID=1871066 RepID=UPI00257F0A5C|nr:HNH endonuclease [Mesorhizobium sp.]
MSVLVRDRFTCQRCKLLESDTSKLVCDHITPHRNDEAKFWSGPFQTLCRNCHSGAKQKEESSMPTGVWY